MMLGIFAVMMWGIIVGIIPMFLFFEIYHFARRKSYISYPFVKGILVGSSMGTIVLYFLLKDSHGESGLAFIGFSPFVVVGFIVVGILVAWFYKWRSKPLFLRSFRMKNNIFGLVITLLLLSIFLTSCYGEMSGTVIDAETGKPIEGAIVLVEWTKTKGLGLTYTESYKVVETVTDKEGKATISGIFNPLINPPHLTIYKKGYVAWNNEYIFPDYKKRTDFVWTKGYLFKLDKFDEGIYSHKEHVLFIYSPIAESSKIPLYYDAIRWETMMMQKERGN